jgi:DNA-binding GntR family transcriptional regulator
MIGWSTLRSHKDRLERQTLHQTLIQHLIRMIENGELAPGERLSEAALCERFEVSRTPLREALKVLAFEGFLIWRPNRGITVAEIRIDEVIDAFELLTPIEHVIGEALLTRATAADISQIEAMHAKLTALHANLERRAYFQLNQEIHAQLAASTRNPIIEDVYCSLQRRIYRARSLSNTIRLRWDESIREHDAFMVALWERDPSLPTLLAAHSEATRAEVCRQAEAQANRPDSNTALGSLELPSF